MLQELFKPVLKEAQELMDKEYAEKGLTEEVLDNQVKLNTIRNTLDIHDEREEVYEEYVQ